MDEKQPSPRPPGGSRRAHEVVVVTTALLTFIPWWRAAAVVLCDMASTAYYVGGIAERAVGEAAVWYIFGVLVFAGALAAVYLESCSMFIRGGVYRVVKEALGGTLAKVSVSALMFDYLLTGPISSVSAGQYLVGLLNILCPHLHIGWKIPVAWGSVAFACLITLYFWRKNVIGIEESSEKSWRIMQMTTVMGVILLAWSGYTLWLRGFDWPSTEAVLSEEALGWLRGSDWMHTVGCLGVLAAFGHSFLGLSGLETMAQVYREIEAPKLPNLKKAAVAIVLFSAVLTGFATFAAVAIVPDDVRIPLYADNLLSGLAMFLEGPLAARLAFQSFVVLAGFMILSGAVNTAIFGSNSVLNRLAEDGILTDWFRGLHHKFGTTHRMINIVVALQLLLIVISQGDVYLLGEAYAFGVIWSFVFMVFAVTMLRFKEHTVREWRVPFNLSVGRLELPFGLAGILAVLLAVAGMNLLTKKMATVSGALFTAGFFGLFTVSERLNERKRREGETLLEKFNMRRAPALGAALPKLARENRVLVAVRDHGNLYPLRRVLETVDLETTDIVVMTSIIAKGFHLEGEASGRMRTEEQLLFTNVLNLAEKYGGNVHPLLVLSNDPSYAIAQAAQALKVQQVVLGASMKIAPETQIERLAMTWGALENPEPVTVRILWDGKELSFTL